MNKQLSKKKPLILVVEDEWMIADSCRIILEAEGYKVQVASEGKQALELLKDSTPDLILLDLRMPVMDGLEFLKNVDLPNNYPNLPVIVFSNYDVQKDVDEAYSYGATRYILKAWASPKELAKVVKETLAGANS